MKEVVVSVKNINKKYLISHKVQNNTLRDSLISIFKKNPLNLQKNNNKQEVFNALKNISFDVYKGETLGIIGGNGAGKSTLLKILSKIIEPTSGEFIAKGRVASLLEVGTGFHPELTGRENIYFNGSILGMKKKEINAKFEEIVNFSEIERFIDTPVKHYSSGMYVRLAFSIAAHLDPDVLIIDEALAVGDYSFQQKCIEKMRNTARSGKTVLFVSHSMSIVEDLCDRAILIEKGKITSQGNSRDVINNYIGKTIGQLTTSWSSPKPFDPGNNSPILANYVKLTNSISGKILPKTIKKGLKIRVELGVTLKSLSNDISIGLSVIDNLGLHLFRTSLTDQEDGYEIKLKTGLNKLWVDIDTNIFKDGEYIFALDCDQNNSAWHHNPYFTKARTRLYIKRGDFPVLEWGKEREGIFKLSCEWGEERLHNYNS